MKVMTAEQDLRSAVGSDVMDVFLRDMSPTQERIVDVWSRLADPFREFADVIGSVDHLYPEILQHLRVRLVVI